MGRKNWWIRRNSPQLAYDCTHMGQLVLLEKIKDKYKQERIRVSEIYRFYWQNKYSQFFNLPWRVVKVTSLSAEFTSWSILSTQPGCCCPLLTYTSTWPSVTKHKTVFNTNTPNSNHENNPKYRAGIWNRDRRGLFLWILCRVHRCERYQQVARHLHLNESMCHRPQNRWLTDPALEHKYIYIVLKRKSKHVQNKLTSDTPNSSNTLTNVACCVGPQIMANKVNIFIIQSRLWSNKLDKAGTSNKKFFLLM